MKDVYDFLKSFDLHTIIVVGIAFWCLNANINDQLKEIRSDMVEVKSDIRVIKTVLIMKGIMPQELACQEEK